MKELSKIKPKKSLGQHFLKNPQVAKTIVDTANLKKGDIVLEIGPGTGFLTKELLKSDAQIIAVEADDRAIPELKHTFSAEIASKKLILKYADIRHTTLIECGVVDQHYKTVANIPYYLSGQLFRLFLSGDVQPTTLVFLVQKEVAERIARSKKESLLSLSVKVYGSPEYIQTVARGNFNPLPKVASAILKVRNISRKNFKNMDEAFFFEILHLGFASKAQTAFGQSFKKI